MSLSDETGVSSRRGLRRASIRRRGCDTADFEGGDGRCTAYGRTIRRGGAADDDPCDAARRGTTPATTDRPHRTHSDTQKARGPRRPASAPAAPAGERCGERRRRAPRAPAAPGSAGPGEPSARGCSPARPRPGLRGGYAVGAALGWGSRELAADHGRLRAQRRRRCSPPSPASSTRAARRSRFRPAWLLFAPLLRHGRRWATRSGAGTRSSWAARCPARPLRRPVLPLLRAARHRRTAGARQAAGDQGRLGLPRRWTPG